MLCLLHPSQRSLVCFGMRTTGMHVSERETHREHGRWLSHFLLDWQQFWQAAFVRSLGTGGAGPASGGARDTVGGSSVHSRSLAMQRAHRSSLLYHSLQKRVLVLEVIHVLFAPSPRAAARFAAIQALQIFLGASTTRFLPVAPHFIPSAACLGWQCTKIPAVKKGSNLQFEHACPKRMSFMVQNNRGMHSPWGFFWAN